MINNGTYAKDFPVWAAQPEASTPKAVTRASAGHAAAADGTHLVDAEDAVLVRYYVASATSAPLQNYHITRRSDR